MKNIILAVVKYLMVLFTVLFPATFCHGQTISDNVTSSENKVKPYIFPLGIGGQGNRYLNDSNNQPFFWLGDAAWSLIAQTSREDADYYLKDRHDKGFSVILVSLIEHKFCTNAPADFYGELPFKGRAFTNPNGKYFEHADYIIKSAAQKNIIVLLAPLYLGYDCRDEGWCAEVKAASASELYSWGQYLGKRYRDFSNIVWIIGGDTDPSGVKDKVHEMIRGIRENDTLHLFSAHNQPETMAIDPWDGESWLTLNNVYSYDSILYKPCKAAYAVNPPIPYFLCESAYENEHQSTPQQLRAQAYQAILSGAMGHISGNCPIWHFGAFQSWCGLTDWKTELNNAGSVSMDHFQRLFRSRSWQLLTPDFENRVLTAGFGTWGWKDYVTTAITNDGNTIISYLPSRRTVTADLGKVSGGRAICRWYDPSCGKTLNIGTFKTRGSQSFTPPSEGDWVLVIDNADVQMPEPGRSK